MLDRFLEMWSELNELHEDKENVDGMLQIARDEVIVEAGAVQIKDKRQKENPM